MFDHDHKDCQEAKEDLHLMSNENLQKGQDYASLAPYRGREKKVRRYHKEHKPPRFTRDSTSATAYSYPKSKEKQRSKEQYQLT